MPLLAYVHHHFKGFQNFRSYLSLILISKRSSNFYSLSRSWDMTQHQKNPSESPLALDQFSGIPPMSYKWGLVVQCVKKGWWENQPINPLNMNTYFDLEKIQRLRRLHPIFRKLELHLSRYNNIEIGWNYIWLLSNEK